MIERLTTALADRYRIDLKTGAQRSIANLPPSTRWPGLSPDGKWLAYGANEQGATISDVYVQPWPALDRKWKVSTGGGASPAWSKEGRELLYVVAAGLDSLGATRFRMMAVQIDGPEFSAGTPRELFTTTFTSTSPIRNWDVTADGSRFLVATGRPVHSPAGEIHVLVDWLAAHPELTRGRPR